MYFGINPSTKNWVKIFGPRNLKDFLVFSASIAIHEKAKAVGGQTAQQVARLLIGCGVQKFM